MTQTQKAIYMPATICKINNFKDSSFQYPEFLFFDTSFLIQCFVPVPAAMPGFPTRNNQLCSDFLDVLKFKSKNNEICLFTCDNVLNEFFNYILKRGVEFDDLTKPPFDLHTDNYRKRNFNPSTEIFKDHPELVTKHFPLIDHFYYQITTLPIAVLGPEFLVNDTEVSIPEKMNQLIKDYQILPSDALNIAIAYKAGIKNIAAVDLDYHRVDEINVFTYLTKPRKCFTCNMV